MHLEKQVEETCVCVCVLVYIDYLLLSRVT